jgi:hypothetical protein
MDDERPLRRLDDEHGKVCNVADLRHDLYAGKKPHGSRLSTGDSETRDRRL